MQELRIYKNVLFHAQSINVVSLLAYAYLDYFHKPDPVLTVSPPVQACGCSIPDARYSNLPYVKKVYENEHWGFLWQSLRGDLWLECAPSLSTHFPSIREHASLRFMLILWPSWHMHTSKLERTWWASKKVWTLQVLVGCGLWDKTIPATGSICYSRWVPGRKKVTLGEDRNLRSSETLQTIEFKLLGNLTGGSHTLSGMICLLVFWSFRWQDDKSPKS